MYMPFYYRIIGVLNLLILALLIVMTFYGSSLLTILMTPFGFIVFLLPIIILSNLGTLNLLKYYREKPFNAMGVDLVLLWVPLITGLLIVYLAIPILKQFFG